MNSDSKGFAIFAISFIVGFLGSIVAGWPALVAAAIGIAAVALAPNTDTPADGRS